MDNNDNNNPSNVEQNQPSGEVTDQLQQEQPVLAICEGNQGNMYLPDDAYDEDLFKQQLDLIKQEAEAGAPLITGLTPVSDLEVDFVQNQAFLQKIHNLKATYPLIRRVRRDGSCFYRSLLFKLLEEITIKKDKELQQATLEIIKKSKQELQTVGYEEMVLEDFYDPLVEKLEQVIDPAYTREDLLNAFNEKYVSDSLVMYMRFMTSGYLKMNAALYENYIENGLTIERFCATEVDPIDKEADQIPIMALINYLNVAIKIIYLDANINKLEADVIVLPEGTDPSKAFITLLYRPGHYDVVYSSE